MLFAREAFHAKNTSKLNQHPHIPYTNTKSMAEIVSRFLPPPDNVGSLYPFLKGCLAHGKRTYENALGLAVSVSGVFRLKCLGNAFRTVHVLFIQFAELDVRPTPSVFEAIKRPGGRKTQ